MITLRSSLDLVDRLAASVARYGRSALWPLYLGVSLGSGLWASLHLKQLAVLSTNDVKWPDRLVMTAYAGVGLALAALVYGGVYALVRRRHGRRPAWRAVRRLHRPLGALFAWPALMALGQPKIESDHPFITLGMIFTASLCVLPTAIAARRAWRQRVAPKLEAWLSRQPSRLPTGAVVAGGLALLAVAYAAWFARLGIQRHHSMQTDILDLGIYDNIFYQTIHGNFLGCSLIRAGYHGSAHFDPILALLSPLYLLYPRPELILVLQAIWCGLGVVPVYLLGRHLLTSRGAGFALAIAYTLYPALHGANMYEFHSLTLLGPPLLLQLYFLVTGRFRAYWLLLPLLLTIREDVSLLMCCIGGYAVLTRERSLVRLGWITIVAAGTYLLAVKVFFMTSPALLSSSTDDAYGYTYYYQGMAPSGRGTELVLSLLTNPAYVAQLMLSSKKLLFLLQLLVPLVFLPVLARRGRFLLAYGAVFIFLSSREAVFSVSFQYSLVFFPMLFLLAPLGLRQLRDGDWLRRFSPDRHEVMAGVLAAMLVASALSAWKFGAIFDNNFFRGGFHRVALTYTEAQQRQYEQFRRLIERIPPEASVTVTRTGVGPHVSNRAEAYQLDQRKKADYLLIDEKHVKGADKEWVDAQVRSRQVVELDSLGTIKLYVRRPENAAPPPPPPPAGEPATAAVAPGPIPPLGPAAVPPVVPAPAPWLKARLGAPGAAPQPVAVPNEPR